MTLKTAPINKASGKYGVFAPPAIITLAAATTLTSAAYANRTLLLGAAGASLTMTLPASIGSGDKYKFYVSVVNTSNYLIQVANANDTMDGNILTNSTGDTPDVTMPWPTAGDSDRITLNGTTQGGVAIGDWIELVDIANNQWAVMGLTTSSGTEATPFSASV